MQDRLIVQERATGSISKQLDALEITSDAFREETRQRFDGIEKTIHWHEGLFADMRADQIDTRDMVAKLVQTSDKHGQMLGKLQEGQERLEDRQRKLEDGQTKLEDGQKRLEDRQTKLEDGQAALQTEVREFKVEQRQQMGEVNGSLAELKTMVKLILDRSA